MGIAPDAAFYVYAVVPAGRGAAPDAAAFLGGSLIGAVREAGLAALVSVVMRAAFVGNDPVWGALCAEGHDKVVRLVAETGPCLPVGCGTLFGSADRVRGWLAAHSGPMHRMLETLSGRREWGLALSEDPPLHAAWLVARDPALQDLAALARAARPGTGALLQRRLAQAVALARTGHAAAVGIRLRERLREEGFWVHPEPADEEGTCWRVLAPCENGLAECLNTASNGLFVGTGLSLRISGPWPPYAFARAAWQETLCA